MYGQNLSDLKTMKCERDKLGNRYKGNLNIE